MKINFRIAATAMVWLFAATSTSVSATHYPQDETCTPFLADAIACVGSGVARCAPLPLPAATEGPPLDPATGYYIQKIRTGVYGVTDGSYWLLVMVADMQQRRLGKQKKKKKRKKSKDSGKTDLLIIDFPAGGFAIDNDMGQRVGSTITTAVEEILEMESINTEDLDEVTMLYSHNHLDHIGSARVVRDHITDVWGKDVTILASKGTQEDLERREASGLYSFNAPVPTDTFDEEYELKVGKNLVVELSTVSAHTGGEKDVIIFVERDDDDDEPAVLMVVDVVYANWAPYYGFALAADLLDYRDIHDILLSYDFMEGEVFCGGHLNQLGTRNDIVKSKALFETVVDGALKGLQEANPGPDLAELDFFNPESSTFGNIWLSADVYFDLVKDICLKEVLAEFGCVIGSIDITGRSLCEQALYFWTVDF